MSDDTKPTPAAGMPAVTEPGPSSINDAMGQKLLSTIEEVRDEARDRFGRIEGTLTDVKRELSEVRGETRSNTKNIGEQADALTRVSVAAAHACDTALDAKRQAAAASDDTRKIVESALTIHGTSIAMTVDSSVTKVVAPLIVKVDSLEKAKEDTARTLAAQDIALGELKRSDDETTTTLSNQNDTLKAHGDQIAQVDTKVGDVATSVKTVVENVGTIAAGVSKLVRWQDQWWVKALLGAAAIASALYYGYEKASHEPPPAPTVIVAPQLTAPTASH